MKIAIQGHPTRGKEVIQILESLGGINDGLHEGNNPDCYYELHGNIIWCVSTKGINFKYYTLEEFEEEFPFKVGDKVIFPVINWASGKVTGIKDFEYEVDTKGNYRYVEPHKLSLYQMKEERNVTLTLDKAKEWYKKGGELKEIALQAFNEKELNPLPRSWEEFCENYPVKMGEACIDDDSEINIILDNELRDKTYYKNLCLSKKSAEAHLAMIQLEQLRNCWWNGWEPEYNCGTKYTIKWDKDDLIVATSGRIRAFLIFPTRETAEEFLKCFRDLIEKAGDLI